MAEPGDALRTAAIAVKPASRVVEVPPRLRSGQVSEDRRAQELQWPFWASGALLVTLSGLHLASVWGLPLPLCGLREATGYPCPLCGSTRAALALAQGNWVQAWRGNPLATASLLGAGMLGAAALADRCLGTRILAKVMSLGWRWGTWRTVTALLLANWLYLLANQRP